jgi:hypothetical protein
MKGVARVALAGVTLASASSARYAGLGLSLFGALAPASRRTQALA